MLRLRLAAAAITALALAGCSSASSPSWVPSWLTTSPPLQPLQFESQPPGADVTTAQGQTCRTPCSLALPLTNQSVSFALNGYVPQTVPVTVLDSSTFMPNPVEVALQPIAKPGNPKAKLPKTSNSAPKTRTAAKPTTPPPAPPTASVAPSAQDNAFPPPPPMQSTVGARFPDPSPPPPTR